MNHRFLIRTLAGLPALAAASAASAAPSCPATHFPDFVAAFAETPAMQRAFTTDPLLNERIDPAADPEPATVAEMLSGDARGFPVMPNAATQKREGLQQTISASANGDAVVTLARTDSDAQIRYIFRKSDACWQLYRRADDSL